MKALTTLIFLSVTITVFSQEATCLFELPDSILFENIQDIKVIRDIKQIPNIKILDTLQNSFGTVILFEIDTLYNYSSYIAMKKTAAWEYFIIPYDRGVEILTTENEENGIQKQDHQLFLKSSHRVGNSSSGLGFGYSGGSLEEEYLLFYDLKTKKQLIITTEFYSQHWGNHYEDKEGKIVDAEYLEERGLPEDSNLDSLFTNVSRGESEHYSCQYFFEKNNLKLECECSSSLNGNDNPIISKNTKNYLLKSDKFIIQGIAEKKR